MKKTLGGFPGPGEVVEVAAGRALSVGPGQALILGAPVTCDGAAVVDQSDGWTVVEVAGRHRERYLQSQLTSDLRQVAVGGSQLSALLDASGRLQGFFHLTRLADGGFLAVSRECTHLGCTVPWMAEEGRFVCPCHSSAYDIRGDVLSPPAPRALDIHPVRIENGIVKVDTGRTRQRRYFEASQVARA